MAAQNLSRSGMTQLASAAMQWLDGPRKRVPSDFGASPRVGYDASVQQRIGTDLKWAGVNRSLDTGTGGIVLDGYFTSGATNAWFTKNGASALKIIGWFSVGIAVAAIGVIVGNELRSRYKFKQRTPYDFYANAGESQASEYGVGI